MTRSFVVYAVVGRIANFAFWGVAARSSENGLRPSKMMRHNMGLCRMDG